MIEIKVYKNGYEITGHAEEKICHQVSMWHWITSNLILGLDSESREYTTHTDNKADVNEGLSWVICDIQKGNLEWILEDCIVSVKMWREKYWGNQVAIKHVDDVLIKD